MLRAAPCELLRSSCCWLRQQWPRPLRAVEHRRRCSIAMTRAEMPRPWETRRPNETPRRRGTLRLHSASTRHSEKRAPPAKPFAGKSATATRVATRHGDVWTERGNHSRPNARASRRHVERRPARLANTAWCNHQALPSRTAALHPRATCARIRQRRAARLRHATAWKPRILARWHLAAQRAV
jgi:hypothetical protein